MAGNGRITSHGVFSVSINGATPADEVTVAASDTSTNQAVGNDIVLGPVTFSFHADAEGGLNDAGQFSKTEFGADKNSVTLTKLMYLMEDDPLAAGPSVADNQLSELYGDILTALALADDPMAGPVAYEFGLLNMHGAHGGNSSRRRCREPAGTPDVVDRFRPGMARGQRQCSQQCVPRQPQQ